MTPMAARRRWRRRLSTANGSAGLATRHVSSRNTERPPSVGIAYRKEGTSFPVPHSPSPELGCSPGFSLRKLVVLLQALLPSNMGGSRGHLRLCAPQPLARVGVLPRL